MCDPASAMLALSVASAGASYIGGQNQLEATQSAASSNLQQQLDANYKRQEQINAQSSDKQMNTKMQNEAALGKLHATSGESGVQLNGDRMAQSQEMAYSMDMATIEANRKAGIEQSVLEDKGYVANAQSTINQASSKAPSLLGTGLQIAGSGVTYADKKGYI